MSGSAHADYHSPLTKPSMPATESTWRNQPLLHRIFAVSGLLLTLTTIWMFYADHERTWKEYQVQTLNIDQTMNLMRQEQVESSAAYLAHEKHEEELAVAAAAPIPSGLVDAFLDQLAAYYATKQWSGIAKEQKRVRGDLEKVNTLAEQAATAQQAHSAAAKQLEANPGKNDLQDDAKSAGTAARKAAEAARAQRAAFLDDLRSKANDVRIDEDKALNYRKVRMGLIDAAKAQRDIAIRDGLSDKEIRQRQEYVYELEGKDKNGNLLPKLSGLAELNDNYQKLGAQRKKMEETLKQITADEDLARKNSLDAQADLKRLETTFTEKRETWAQSDRYPLLGKKWLTFPILDAFGTPRKIDNLWSDGLMQDYNFSEVRRYDRCTTCHQSLPKSLPGESSSPAYD